jgi:hypothetical protein
MLLMLEILFSLQSYEKTSKKERKAGFSFLFRVQVTSAKPKLRKIESRTKRTSSFFMPRWSNLSKVTKKACKEQRILED